MGSRAQTIRLLLCGVALWPLGACSLGLAGPQGAVDRSAYRGLENDPAVVAVPAASSARPWLAPAAINLGEPLDGNAVSVIAVVANPDLRALRKRVGVAEAQVYAAGLLPDPVISFGADFVVGGPATTLGNALAGSLSQDLNGLRTRGAALAAAKANAQQVRLDLAWAEWQTAGQARLLSSRAISLETQIGLLQQMAGLARDLRIRNQRAAGRGDIAGDQLQAARLAETDALTQLNQAEAELTQVRQDLLRTLGLSPTTVLELAPWRIDLTIPDCMEVYSRARQRPDLLALEAGFDAQSASVRQALLERFPSLGLSVNGSRNEGGNRFLGPAVSLTLPLWNRGRGSIAVAQATRDALQAEYDARLFQTRADVFGLCAAMEVNARQLGVALSELPGLEQYARATVSAAQRGDLAQAVADNALLTWWGRKLLSEQLRQSQIERAIGIEVASGAVMQSWGMGGGTKP